MCIIHSHLHQHSYVLCHTYHIIISHQRYIWFKTLPHTQAPTSPTEPPSSPKSKTRHMIQLHLPPFTSSTPPQSTLAVSHPCLPRSKAPGLSPRKDGTCTRLTEPASAESHRYLSSIKRRYFYFTLFTSSRSRFLSPVPHPSADWLKPLAFASIWVPTAAARESARRISFR